MSSKTPNRYVQLIEKIFFDHYADGDTEGAGLAWGISGGLDEQHFTLDSRGGLRFITSPDYERPLDSDTDNFYEVEVKVCDSDVACDVQLITVEITDLQDTNLSHAPTILNNNSAPARRSGQLGQNWADKKQSKERSHLPVATPVSCARSRL